VVEDLVIQNKDMGIKIAMPNKLSSVYGSLKLLCTGL
jgi:hypothetical protein